MKIREETWDRLTTVLKQLTHPTIKLSVPGFVSPGKQQYEGVVIVVLPARGQGQARAQRLGQYTISWQLQLLGGEAGLGLSAQKQREMLVVADLVHDALNRDPQLKDPTTGQGLRWLERCSITGDDGLQLVDYPGGGSVQWYAYTLELTCQYQLPTC